MELRERGLFSALTERGAGKEEKGHQYSLSSLFLWRAEPSSLPLHSARMKGRSPNSARYFFRLLPPLCPSILCPRLVSLSKHEAAVHPFSSMGTSLPFRPTRERISRFSSLAQPCLSVFVYLSFAWRRRRVSGVRGEINPDRRVSLGAPVSFWRGDRRGEVYILRLFSFPDLLSASVGSLRERERFSLSAPSAICQRGFSVEAISSLALERKEEPGRAEPRAAERDGERRSE